MAGKKKEEKLTVTPNPPIKKKVDSEKLKALKLTMDQIEKDHGKGTIMMLGEKPIITGNVVSTGSFGLDIALGIGGIPKGRIIEIYGPESSGKTTLAMHIIREIQKQGGIAAVIDVEHAFDKAYAKKLGLDVDDLLFSQPDYAEQGLDVADKLIASGGVDIVLIDSVSALVPKSELDGNVGDSKMGLQARIMGQTLRKIAGTTSKSNCIVIFINQLREKIGIMFGNPETTTGGNALKFYATIRMDVRRSAQLKDGEEVIGNRVKVKVVKNKVAPPFKTAEFDLIFGEGIDITGEILDAATACNVVAKSGSWFSYKTDKLGQGRNAVIDLLKDNPEILLEIKEKVLSLQIES